ncbi:DUF4173 domain-containing protein [Glycomyces sp. A-F 0318]|uniref:DUF4153 domain-containing protein n=1 Tax=Glycomyces amatae TaxID=2881355 RepID=UPI001E43AFEE|nr:DUF4173 domain-containing protein [Glycomyces amatae]MCD0446034.1 DUF4173 domain-containing protein [Glycomyces amatae]
MSDPADTPAPRPDDAEARPAEDAPSQAEAPDAAPDTAHEPPHAPEAAPGPRHAAPVEQPGAAAPPPAHPQTAPPQQLTPEQAARQAAYYRHLNGPAPMLPPNPRWHRPELSTGQSALLLAIAVALFGAWAAFPGGGVGIGLSITGIALVAVPLALGDPRDLVPRLPGAVLVAALWSVAAVRDAGWVVALCSLAAFALTPVVLAPQRRFGGNAIMLCLGWLEGLAESFRWAKRTRRGRDGGSAGTMRGLWTALVTVGLLVVFGGLFAAADSTFADLVAGLMPELNPVEVFLRLMLAAILFPLAVVWIYAAIAKPRFDGEGRGDHRTVSRFELAIPLGALNLLFAAFIAVQLRVYVGGEDYVRETAGLTFAEYARQGFWQLGFVAFLTLTVIAVAAWLAPKRAKEDRWTVRLLLGPLGLMSLVVVASALYRMYTYFETFGLTRLRVWVFTVEIWLAVLFALVLVCCWKLRATWLPRAVLASGALALLGLAAANPDALIARYNIDHDHTLDVHYLQGLSNDAVPELAALSGEDRECVLNSFAAERDERDFMAWNLGYQRAGGLLPKWDGDWGACRGGDDSDSAFEDPGYEDPVRPGETEPEVEETTAAEATDPAPAASGFFHWDTCAMYDLGMVTELFGTSAKGDRGVVPDDPSQYAEDLAPDLGRGYRVLHCGYYGPGMDYLMVETYQWPSADDALGGVQAMQADQESSGIYDVAPTTAGYVATQDSDTGTYEYAAAVGETVVVVSLSGSGLVEGAEPVCADLVDQSYALYGEFA